MTLRSDSQGFLIGELVESSNEQIDVLKTGNRTLGRIDSNVSAIARALGVAARSNGKVQEPAGRGSGGGGSRASGARGGAGSVSGGRSMPAQRSGFGAPNARATVSPAGRDSRGRFVARTGSSKAGEGGRDDKGRFTPGGSGDGGGSGGGGLLGRLGGLTDAIKGIGNGADQIDPTLAAMSEVKGVVEPLGRGFMAMFGRNVAQKKERWYNRIWKTLTNIERKPVNSGPGGMPMDAGDSSVMGGVAGLASRFLPAILTAVGAVLAVGIGALAGTAIGTALYDWLTKSGLMAKIFDSIDFVIGKFKKIPEAIAEVKNNFNKGQNEVLNPVKSAPPLLDSSGRNLNDARRLDVATAAGPDGRMINDPRRLDAAAGELPPSTSVAQSLGRGKGYAGKFLRDKMGFVPLTDENDPTKNMAEKARAKRVLASGGGYNVIEKNDGSVVRQDGARNWRNNNPGNIEDGKFARSMGAIGSDGRFAVFPDYETGRKAKESLIFEGNGYKNLALKDAISRYAPPSENNTVAYQNAVLGSVGNQNKRMGDYTLSERSAILDSMQKVEGYKVGRTSVSGPPGGPNLYMPKSATTINTAGGYKAYSPPVMPSFATAKIPAAPEVQIPTPSAGKDRPMEVSVRQPVGQEISDRGIAQIASGGIGRPRGW